MTQPSGASLPGERDRSSSALRPGASVHSATKSANAAPLMTLVVLNSSWNACSSMFHSATLPAELGLLSTLSKGYDEMTLRGDPESSAATCVRPPVVRGGASEAWGTVPLHPAIPC